MEKSLSLLKQKQLLSEWHDDKILPGRSISAATQSHQENSHIVAFLVSQNFIASDECMKEWTRAKNAALDKPSLFRIPIILEECAWFDLLEDDDIKALPHDGNPVSGFSDPSSAWQQVYEGIKSVVAELRQTFEARPQYIKRLQQTEFFSESTISLSDIFVFPRLSTVVSVDQKGKLIEDSVLSEDQALQRSHLLVHGQEMSGKTALARFLSLRILERAEPVLYVDLHIDRANQPDKLLVAAYNDAFEGDYAIWMDQPSKTLILDNFSADVRDMELLDYAKRHFTRTYIFTSTDIFSSYFKDDSRLSDYEFCKFKLSHMCSRKN